MSSTSRNTVVTLIGNGLTLLLGLGVIVLVGQRFGANREMDAFWAANTLPNIVGQIFLSVSLLLLSPVFIRRRAEEGEEAAWQVGNTFLTATILAGLLLAILLWTIAPSLIRIVAPGFDASTAHLAGRLLRILSASVLALALTGAISALLISHHRFAIAALARPLSLMCVLVGLWFAASHLGVRGYAYAVVTGSLAALILVAGGMWAYRGRIRPQWSWKSQGMTYLLAMLPVILLARALDQGNQVVTRAIASTLPVGSISALGYAWTLFQVPGILGASLGTVVYPQFSEKFADGRRGELVAQLARCCRILLIVSCPLCAILLCLAQPIIQVFFERGHFDHADTLLTAGVVAAYGAGVLATSINTLIGNLYWSMGLVRIRVCLEAGGIVVCAALGLALARAVGPAGLALATSLMYLGLASGGLLLLRYRFLRVSQWKGLFADLGRTLGCGAMMGLVMFATRVAISWIDPSPLTVLVTVLTAGMGVYLPACWIWQQKDAMDLWGSLRRVAAFKRTDTSLPPLALTVNGEPGIAESSR